MKAVFIERHGGPEELKYGDLPDPVAKPGEVVVDIHAASVNGADWKVRAGESYPQTKFPYVLGRDFSGVVSAVGEGVSDLRVGDAVFAVCDVGQEGAYAEKIAIKAAIVAKKPASLSHVDAAAMALAGLTALVAVEDTLKLKAGETDPGPGRGGRRRQLCHPARQAHRRARDHHRQRRQPRLRAWARRRRGHRLQRAGLHQGRLGLRRRVRHCRRQRHPGSFAVLKPGGRAAFIASGAQAPKPSRADVQSLRPNVARDRPHLERIVALHAAGAVRPPEVRLFPLSEAVAAHKVSQSRHLRGKLVFKVR